MFFELKKVNELGINFVFIKNLCNVDMFFVFG